MSGRTPRQFTYTDPNAPYRQAIIIGLTGPSFSGKTFSALRMSEGMHRVVGGNIDVIDTESDRARHYEDDFDFHSGRMFRHKPLAPPYSALDYLDAIDHSVANGASIIIIDSLSHEHDGEGGLLDQMEKFLEAKEEEYKAKGWNFNSDTFKFTSQIKPKRERKKLEQRIVGLGKQVIFILLYKAAEKIRPRKKGEKDREPENMGWQPITTSRLPYDMTVRFLLKPASDGVPILMPPTDEEKLLIKLPKQFRGWFKEGDQISQEMGERLAKWAQRKGGAAPVALTVAEYESCDTVAKLTELERRRADAWKAMPPSAAKNALKAAADAAKARLAAGAAAATTNVQADLVGEPPLTEQTALAKIREAQTAEDVDAVVALARRDIPGEFPVSIDATAHDRKEALTQL